MVHSARPPGLGRWQTVTCAHRCLPWLEAPLAPPAAAAPPADQEHFTVTTTLTPELLDVTLETRYVLDTSYAALSTTYKDMRRQGLPHQCEPLIRNTVLCAA